MKLRNKKTGKVFNIAFCSNYMEEKIVIGVETETDPVYPKCNFCDYKSLKELCEEWEDYTPKEPLIKNEKVRRAVSVWLSVQEQPIVEVAITCNKDNDGFFNYRLYGYIEEARISNGKAVKNKNLTAIGFEFRSLEEIEFDVRRDYTITELCGEEEE